MSDTPGVCSFRVLTYDVYRHVHGAVVSRVPKTTSLPVVCVCVCVPYIGVRLPHYVIYNRLNWQWNRFPYTDTERVCVFKTSLTFVDSVAELWAPLLHDPPRCLMVVPKVVTKDPERLINTLHENKVRARFSPYTIPPRVRYARGREIYERLRNKEKRTNGITLPIPPVYCSSSFSRNFEYLNRYVPTHEMRSFQGTFRRLFFVTRIPISLHADRQRAKFSKRKPHTEPGGK